MDTTLSVATISGKSGPESNDNEGVLCISQSSSITGTLPSDCLVSYPGHLLQESYPSAEMQSVYSTAPADETRTQQKLTFISSLQTLNAIQRTYPEYSLIGRDDKKESKESILLAHLDDIYIYIYIYISSDAINKNKFLKVTTTQYTNINTHSKK